MTTQEKVRLHLLDAFRGFLLLHMIAFHGMWNLVYLFGVRAPWYTAAPGYIWQQFICWSFILLSGFLLDTLPTPLSVPGESRGQRSLAGCRPWGHRVGHD